MKSKERSAIGRTIACLAIVTLVLFVGGQAIPGFVGVNAEPGKWVVDDDGPADFSSIQEAINAANTGDIIYVKNGTYYLNYTNLIVNKTVSLLGENWDSTIISGHWAHNRGPVWLEADNVTFTGFTVHLQSFVYYGSCIMVDHSRNNNISHNILDAGDVGIHLLCSDNNFLVDNQARTNQLIGISLQNSTNNIVSNNSASNFPDAVGLLLTENSANNLVIGNNVSLLHTGIMLEDSSNNTIVENAASQCLQSGISLKGNCSDNTIAKNKVSNNNCGIEIDGDFTGLNVFYHNEFTENTVQARIVEGSVSWDKDYPTGGNYWSDFKDQDLYSGPFQNETGSDGIFDDPYIIDENNIDHYPIIPEFCSLASILLLIVVVTAVILKNKQGKKDRIERHTRVQRSQSVLLGNLT